MADPEHLEKLKQGVESWNEWRKVQSDVKPDLRNAELANMNLTNANLSGVDLSGADLTGANLTGANLSGSQDRNSSWDDAYVGAATLANANLAGACLQGTDLRGANFIRANLTKADFTGANLKGYTDRDGERWGVGFFQADLTGANLSGVNLSSGMLIYANLSGANLSNTNLWHVELNHAQLIGADLSGSTLDHADLSFANLTEADLTDAKMSNCRIYGTSAWNVILKNTVQEDMVITRLGEIHTTVDELEVAQFIHLIMNNAKLKDVLDTVTSKTVLILGRFADVQRKAVLDGLREKLRHFDFLPVVFDFDVPFNKDYTETVQSLAGMSMFVIADLTSPKSTPLELEATVKQFKIPYLPILDISVDPRPFAMLVDLQKSFHWVLPVLKYESKEQLLDEENLKIYIIERAVAKQNELREAKSREPDSITLPKK